jgi:hypothetical protein
MTGTPSRTARVSTARWNLKEAAGKLPTRGTQSAYEAADRGREGLGTQTRQSSGSIRSICDGDGGKVTRLTLGTLPISQGRTPSRGMAGLNGHEAGNGGNSPGSGLEPMVWSPPASLIERWGERTAGLSRGQEGSLHRPEARTSGHGPVPGPRQSKEAQHGS